MLFLYFFHLMCGWKGKRIPIGTTYQRTVVGGRPAGYGQLSEWSKGHLGHFRCQGEVKTF